MNEGIFIDQAGEGEEGDENDEEADAEAAFGAAKAQLEQARLNLQRTKVTAPFAGRVRSARADLGQIV